jgi:6-phosphogluconate dehydrogenase
MRELGIPTPAFSTALAFYDGYRTERLPANLLQAQRDFFGAHTYERTTSRAASSSTPTGPARLSSTMVSAS